MRRSTRRTVLHRAKNQVCTVKGVCGKPGETAGLQDLLIFVCKGISVYGEKLKEHGTVEATRFVCKALFTTITNVAKVSG